MRRLNVLIAAVIALVWQSSAGAQDRAALSPAAG